MTWHGYFAIEGLNLNAGQRQVLIDALRSLGPAMADQPAYLCHWRARLDDRAVLFEAQFDENNLTVDTFRTRLGAIFGVDPSSIDYSLQSTTFSSLPTPVATFSRGGTDYLRMALFGGPGATWGESGDECRAYLAANRAAWEG
jgi:hypothetical protein